MGKLLRQRAQTVSAAGAIEYVYLPLGHCKLRIANCNNATPANPALTVTLQIVDIAYTGTGAADQGISLFQGQTQVGGGIDIGWEGEIELGQDQKLMAQFVNSVTGDILFLTVGVEPLE